MNLKEYLGKERKRVWKLTREAMDKGDLDNCMKYTEKLAVIDGLEFTENSIKQLFDEEIILRCLERGEEKVKKEWLELLKKEAENEIFHSSFNFLETFKAYREMVKLYQEFLEESNV